MSNFLSTLFEYGKCVFGNQSSPSTKPPLIYQFLTGVADFAIFTGRYFMELIKPPYEFKELLKQSYRIGLQSLPLVGITGFIMGLVLTVQTRPTLAEFGAESWLPAMISVSIVREIGPVITALICAGKVGSSIGAELASMRVTEQIDAMEVSGANPFKYIIVTRVLATTLMLPILTVFNDIISMLGSLAGVNIHGDVSFSLFFAQAFAQLSFTDVFPSLIKTIFFGFSIGLIACYKGYNANKGTVGVGEAANSSVVLTSLMVFIIDMLAVQLTSLFIDT
ncbi:MAG TPA: ABC transporter permease [Bacteroidetes bacterium]|jgi:phospholipid/cholesterol/gamma-HCH transport system permease protein|nr:ABC transporter permease [Bacteroidota bacterium]